MKIKCDPFLDSGNGISDHILAHYPDRAFFEHREIFIKHLVKAFAQTIDPYRPGKPATCLDVGCNIGRYTQLMSLYFPLVSGIDFSYEMVSQAKHRYSKLSFHQGDAHQLPFLDDVFDGVSCFGLIQCLPHWRKVLGEIIRVLKPGGYALIETNRAFPLGENLLKTLGNVLMRRLTLKDASEFFRSHQTGASGIPSIPTLDGLGKFHVRDLVEAIKQFPVSELIVHDPRKYLVFHDYVWAVIVRKATGATRQPLRTTHCVACLRTGIGACNAGEIPEKRQQLQSPKSGVS